jgi:hypothetical protein
VRSMAASARGFVRNTLSFKALLAIFWLAAFLLPWLLLVCSYMLKACEVLTGRVPVFVKQSKAIP